MKNLKSNHKALIFLFAIILLGFQTSAQHMASVDTVTESETSISIDKDATNVDISIHGDYHGDHGSNGYIQVQSKNNYRYTSHFKKPLTSEIETLMIKELGEPTAEVDGVKKWNSINGENIEGLNVILKEGKVKIIYKYDTPKIMKKLEDLTKKICKITYRSNCD